jgi:hypothetical protein
MHLGVPFPRLRVVTITPRNRALTLLLIVPSPLALAGIWMV